MAFTFDIQNIKWQKGSYGLPEAVLKVKVPSVGTVIGEMIPDPDWDKFIAEVGKERADQIMTLAGYRGTAMHCFIETFITTYAKTKDVSQALKVTQEESPKTLALEQIPPDKIEEGRNLFYKFYYSPYASTYNNVLGMEMGVYSPSLFYRGKLDILYRDPLFGVALTDFKSSSERIKKGSVKEYKYFCQLGGYANALDEMYVSKGLVIKRAAILCVDKKSDELQEIELSGAKLEEFKETFKTLCRGYHTKLNQEYLIQG